MLLTSDALSDRWEDLDEFEGPADQRVTIVVTTGDGTERAAQTYAPRRRR